jgi:hypothetical protein
MNYSVEFTAALVFVFAASAAWIMIKQLKFNVPVVYGRHENGQFRFRIPTRLSWVLMEAPAALFFSWFVLAGPLPATSPVIVLSSIYCVPWSLFIVSHEWIASIFLIADWSWFAMMTPITV